MKKDHQTCGIISFTLENPHQIDILRYDHDGLSHEETLQALAHFEAFHSRRINPLAFRFLDQQEALALEAGYQLGVPPYGPSPSKRYDR